MFNTLLGNLGAYIDCGALFDNVFNNKLSNHVEGFPKHWHNKYNQLVRHTLSHTIISPTIAGSCMGRWPFWALNFVCTL